MLPILLSVITQKPNQSNTDIQVSSTKNLEIMVNLLFEDCGKVNVCSSFRSEIL